MGALFAPPERSKDPRGTTRRLLSRLGPERPLLALVALLTAAHVALNVVGPRLIDYSDFDPVPKAPTTAEVRGTLSGHVPRVERLTYRLSANVRTSTDTPFPIGPLSGPVPGYDHQETAPVDPFTALAGLAYEF